MTEILSLPRLRRGATDMGAETDINPRDVIGVVAVDLQPAQQHEAAAMAQRLGQRRKPRAQRRQRKKRRRDRWQIDVAPAAQMRERGIDLRALRGVDEMQALAAPIDGGARPGSHRRDRRQIVSGNWRHGYPFARVCGGARRMASVPGLHSRRSGEDATTVRRRARRPRRRGYGAHARRSRRRRRTPRAHATAATPRSWRRSRR